MKSYRCNLDASFESHRALNGHKGAHKTHRYSVTRKKYIAPSCLQCGSSTAHHRAKYCSVTCQQKWQEQYVVLPKFIRGELKYLHIGVVHEFLISRDGRKCASCRRSKWQGLPIPLDIDHVDGDPSNNLPENLRYLCPNCHRQTPSWGNKDGKRSLKERGVHGRRVLKNKDD